jgi:exonuclease III
MKLVSLNMEGTRHLERVVPFLEKEEPAVVTLTEAPEAFANTLTDLGYYTTFAPMLMRKTAAGTYTEGVLLASKQQHNARTTYYHRSAETVVVQVYSDTNNTTSNVVLFAEIQHENNTYRLATTQGMITPDGLPHDLQRSSTQKLLEALSYEPPHFLCGDLNIPRGYNDLYDSFTRGYTDMIPTTYGSSLDKTLHRLGSVPTAELNAPIFDVYMVDYIFTQPPYTAGNVQFKFGISDHAAVIANMSITEYI